MAPAFNSLRIAPVSSLIASGIDTCAALLHAPCVFRCETLRVQYLREAYVKLILESLLFDLSTRCVPCTE